MRGGASECLTVIETHPPTDRSRHGQQVDNVRKSTQGSRRPSTIALERASADWGRRTSARCPSVSFVDIWLHSRPLPLTTAGSPQCYVSVRSRSRQTYKRCCQTLAPSASDEAASRQCRDFSVGSLELSQARVHALWENEQQSRLEFGGGGGTFGPGSWSTGPQLNGRW